MKNSVTRKIETKEPGLYVSILFPMMLAFLVTFIGERFFSHLITWNYVSSNFYWQPSPGLHVHHYIYGFFILAISGYLALIHNGPRGTYLISLLHGFGLGLALDEFGMWLRLRDDDIARWNYDGFFIMVGFFLLLLALPAGWRLFRRLWN